MKELRLVLKLDESRPDKFFDGKDSLYEILKETRKKINEVLDVLQQEGIITTAELIRGDQNGKKE